MSVQEIPNDGQTVNPSLEPGYNASMHSLAKFHWVVI